jgi:hypothetical protein
LHYQVVGQLPVVLPVPQAEVRLVQQEERFSVLG